MEMYKLTDLPYSCKSIQCQLQPFGLQLIIFFFSSVTIGVTMLVISTGVNTCPGINTIYHQIQNKQYFLIMAPC